MIFKSGKKWRNFRNSAAVALILLVLLVFFSLRLQKKPIPKKIIDTEIEGVNLTYLDFDQSNQKKLEIKCRESQKQDDDRLLMKNITATIFKADKLDKDIHISAASGYVGNHFNDMYLQGNAIISSADFSLSSRSYYLAYLEVLTTKDAVDFKLKNLSGQAGKGLRYFMKKKSLKFLQTKGILIRSGIAYDFQTEIFWVLEKRKLLILDKDSSVVGNGATVRGDRISLQFDQDFANLESASAFGHCYFKAVETADHDRERSKEITANMIKIMYDLQGRLQKIVAHGTGKMSMVENQNSGQIESENIEVFMNSETQALEKVRVLTRGTLISRGKENITVSGDLLSAFYSPDGILTASKAEKNCEFSTGDFQGTAEEINYDAQHFRIDIASKDHDAAIQSKKNSFSSSRFLINSKTRQLSSSQNVKATVIPEKKNVLFRAKPLLITAAGMEMTEKGNVIRFKDRVKLFQDEIEMHAGTLLFDSRNNRISAQDNADLKFFNEKELVVLRSKTILFNPQQRNMVVEGDARLNQAENVLTARQIKLAFGKNDLLENISAVDNISFSKKDISGKSQLLFWDYQTKTVLFKNAAQITRKDSGTTKGKELRLNLNTNEIKVSGAGDRSETIIIKEMP